MAPASIVIDAVGGCAKVAEITGRSRVQVWRWMQPKRRGGTNGMIPDQRLQQKILDWSRENGDPVTPAMFFVPLEQAA